MTQVDDELRRALRRIEPPAGFAERVLRRAADGGASRQVAGGTASRTMIRWATAAVLALAVTGGGMWYRAEQRRQAQGEEAKRQVLVGLRIAGSKLQIVQAKVNQ